MTISARVLAALGPLVSVRDGVCDLHEWVEVYTLDETAHVAIDVSELETCSDATLAMWAAAIGASLAEG